MVEFSPVPQRLRILLPDDRVMRMRPNSRLLLPAKEGKRHVKMPTRNVSHIVQGQ